MSTDQEYWDACLIKMWQNFGTVWDAVSMFNSLTGKQTDQVDPPLLRFPKPGFPWKIGMRIFLDQFLPKINDWLHNNSPQNHHKLLEKLKNSKYTTLDSRIGGDKGLEQVTKATYKNRKVNEFNTIRISNRNHDTDWNVVKAPRRAVRA